ncbi:VOC family protein [Paraliomyxa miuraensis]|uniref:VOC family protein n=1 Tax=Paraliomyxa miuraensis TaxID=376150 RepID=UPI0022502243|nr:VOC family protein [Paraliomyxa miuraensis]MCX4241194.1 VOC family protein [Paraliomyxa miuraensis]
MSEKIYTHGRFVWRELLTTDDEGAKGFYGELFGWSFKGMDMPHGTTYWIAHVGDAHICGMMKKPDEAEVPSHWSAYVSVDDVDAAVARAKAKGGSSPMPIMDLDGVGRMGLVIDASGAITWAFKSVHGDTPMTEPPKPGRFCWESLAAKDLEQAKAFYTEVYGWKTSEFNGMTVFGVGEGMENQVADLMLAQEGMPAYWGSHVVVESAADARAKAKRLGGTILAEEIAVPGVGLISVVQDPQGAVISLFQPQM